jgi:hypothetical protein
MAKNIAEFVAEKVIDHIDKTNLGKIFDLPNN